MALTDTGMVEVPTDIMATPIDIGEMLFGIISKHDVFSEGIQEHPQGSSKIYLSYEISQEVGLYNLMKVLD